jgi:hypothetical protein
VCPKNSTQRTGLYAGWEIEFRLPELLLIENILMKLRTKVQRCLSSPNQCLALQLADVKFVKPNLHKTPCKA